MTVGYQDRTVDQLIETLATASVKVLVDVRLTPLSRKPGLSKNGLATRLRDAGIEYLHLPQLGNPRDNRDAFRRGKADAKQRYQAVLATPDARSALDELLWLARQQRVALMCFERDASQCHRAMVVDALIAEAGAAEIAHL
ncbi:DUF488 domain-containing protein [Mycobacterium sp. MMS18-G62]